VRPTNRRFRALDGLSSRSLAGYRDRKRHALRLALVALVLPDRLNFRVHG
jgi:hypothetical protein